MPLFEEAATGIYIKKELAAKMNKRGFEKLRGRPATEKTVENILSKKFYFGTMESEKWKEERRGNHETITDEATWAKAY